eukprot:m.237282 g.237282  ORF g.237282 m.237282 type:complete len:66 (+) comp19368_c0_seq3:1203-1400(+)
MTPRTQTCTVEHTNSQDIQHILYMQIEVVMCRMTHLVLNQSLHMIQQTALPPSPAFSSHMHLNGM